jgi:hypothetical protein
VEAAGLIVLARLSLPQHKPTATIDNTMKSIFFEWQNRLSKFGFADQISARTPKTF